MNWLPNRKREEPPILDHGYLERLSRHIGMRETRELMADGMIDLSDRLDVLARLGASGPIDEIGKLAHEIAGAAGHQGLSAMSRAAVEVANLVREQPETPPDALTDRILQYRETSLDALSEFCNSEYPADVKSG